MKNKEIEELLNELKEYASGGMSGLYPSEDTVKKFVSYIEQLEKQAEQGEHYKHLYSEVKKQKDDVVEYIKNNKYKQYAGRNEFTCEIQYSDYVIKADDLLRMLGEIDEIR